MENNPSRATIYRPNNFDLIRLLAAMQVVIMHGMHHLDIPRSATFGITDFLSFFPGVPIFFVISGFLVSASFERSSSLFTYSINRALRIFPGLWVCFLLSICSVRFLKPEIFQNASLGELAIWTGAQLSILQTYNPDFLRSYGVGVLNGSLWTIPVELEFYFALPFLYWLIGSKSRLNVIKLVGLIFAFLAINQLTFFGIKSFADETWFKLVKYSMLPHFWLFLVGVLAQQNFSRIEWFIRGRFLYWLVGHLCVAALVMQYDLPVGNNHPFPLCGLTLTGLTLAFAFSWRPLSDRILRHNDISYGIYIYHMIIVNAFIQIGLTGRWYYMIYLVVATAACACLSWLLVESPCMKLKKHWRKPATN